MMNIATSADSRTKRGNSRRKLLVLLALVVFESLALAPMLYAHWFLEDSTTPSPPTPRSIVHPHPPPAASQRRRRRREEDGPWEELPSRRQGSAVPYVGDEIFAERYSEKYKGVLPSPSHRNWTSSDPSCGKRPDFFDFFSLSKSDRSRFHEDKIIYDLFKDTAVPFSPSSIDESPLPYGTYVELGAFDGRSESNSRFFDACLGWDGLLIEGQSASYDAVIRNRPRAVKLSFSPTCANEGDVAKFYDYPLSNNGMVGHAKSYEGKDAITVPCGPLTSVLLDVFGPGGNISFLSLDVEGAELLVLDTIDFDVISIDVVMVEIQNTYCPEANCPSVHRIRGRMATTGKYALFVDFLEASDVYVKFGTMAYERAKSIELRRRIDVEWEMRDRRERERKQLVG